MNTNATRTPGDWRFVLIACLSISLVAASVGSKGVIVFENNLSEAHQLLLFRTSTLEERSTPKPGGAEAPPGMIFLAGQYQTDLYTLALSESGGEPHDLWTKEIVFPVATKALNYEIRPLASTIVDGKIYFFYLSSSDRKGHLDVFSKAYGGNWGMRWTRQFELKRTVVEGELRIEGDEVHVFVEYAGGIREELDWE